MNAPRHSNGEGGFGRSASDAAFRGALLIGVAIIIGLLLLWRAHDDDGANASSGDTSNPTTTVKESTGSTTTGAGNGGSTTTRASGPGATATTAAPTAGTKPPNQVKVLVANGTGTQNGASSVTQKLIPKGYATLSPANAATNTVKDSRVYYREGYAEDAKQVARDLGVANPVESIIEAMPANPPVNSVAVERAKTAHILVIIGSDGKIKQT
jgi:hypothetical protein